MSSFEAGAAGARGVRGLEEQRAQKRFDLGSKIIEQEQGKIDASRTYAKELYGVGEKEYDRIFKEKYDAAKAVGTSEMEARKLAQQETLKLLEIEQRATEARERNETQIRTATIGQTGNFNEQARINKITSLKQQARRATDPKVAAELMAQATDLEALVNRGGGGAAAERNDIAAVKAEQVGLLKELENLGLPKDVRQRKQEQLDATYKRLNDLYGGTGAAAPQKGKVVDFSSLPK
jgi:endonuclease III